MEILLLGLVFSSSLLIIMYCFHALWLRPQWARLKLRSQGIRGPTPSFLYGNLPEMQRIQASSAAAARKSTGAANRAGEFVAHDYTSTVFPYFEIWRKQYGSIYTYTTGNRQHLYVNRPEMLKEMNQTITWDFGKPSYLTKRLAPILGQGILRSNGHSWSHQRKIIAPQFFMDKVKGMVGLMVESGGSLIREWEACIQAQGGVTADIMVDEHLRSLSADVIFRACFGGSSSSSNRKQIFTKLRLLQKAISSQSFLFGNRLLIPSKRQKEIKELEKEIESLIWEVITDREKELCMAGSNTASKSNLLFSIMEGAGAATEENSRISKKFIIDNFKNMFLAGHESTAVAASWCLMLLALNPDWQTRVREETARVCPDGVIDASSLPKMKTVTMVIQETLRLYPPAAFVSREALEEIQFGAVTVPKGVCVWTLIPMLHRDTEVWGSDAGEFKPERFANGLAAACKVPHGYIPFGMGQRLCLGQNFAMVQLKIVLSLIISKFSIALSPKYIHSPAYRMIVEPGNGVHIILHRCS
ncbi:cytochrome P450 714A1-like [Impatiens glandulifera]|uniref:cytochrome P450 714A1-like n=1 Tax=Impatiens glandulifera TaxID=253017 RepID=UPI001FB13287|nr:cytochrome P450 714A1-like [Impatiens glandulifera]